jgi:uncharacterized protein YbjT (DUF2867 family)
MIVVTGATGHLGRLVIAALLKKVPASGIVAAVLFDNGHQLSKLINRPTTSLSTAVAAAM